MNAANTHIPNSSSSSTPDPSTTPDRRLLNPLAPPFMFFHPLQFAYPPSAALHHPILNRQQQSQDSSQSHRVPVLQAWYPHPQQQHHTPSATEQHPAPFPAIPPAPADFASPIPLGPMVAVQSLFGFPTTPASENGPTITPSHQGNYSTPGICWDPVVGMFRAGSGTGLFEQMSNSNEGAN